MYNPFTTHKDVFASASFRAVLVTLAAVAAALLVFRAGMLVGYRKAMFASRWSEGYGRNFGGQGRTPLFSDRAFTDAHGAFGRVLEAGGDRLVILGNGPSDEEKVVRVTPNTAVRRFDRDIAPSDLRPDQYVVVVGKPDDQGQIVAKFIRVVPPPNGRGDDFSFHP